MENQNVTQDVVQEVVQQPVEQPSAQPVQPVVAPAVTMPVAKNNQNKMIIGIVVAAVAVVAVVAVIAIAVLALGSSGVDFEEIYDEYCKSTWADVGDDGSYLKIDTNPFDQDDNGLAYADAATAIEEINAALGLPDSVYSDMLETTSLMGKQSETFDDLGITVSWSYHPDNGLEVTYKHAK